MKISILPLVLLLACGSDEPGPTGETDNPTSSDSGSGDAEPETGSSEESGAPEVVDPPDREFDHVEAYCTLAHRVFFTTKPDGGHVASLNWPCIWEEHEIADCRQSVSTDAPGMITYWCDFPECDIRRTVTIAWPEEPGVTAVSFYNPCLTEEWDIAELAYGMIPE